MPTGTIEEIAEQARRILALIDAGVWCVAQEWDNRIDCLIKLPSGDVIGEMITLDQVSEKRIREAGKRLRQRSLGIDVPLVNELRLPVAIVKRPNPD
jgi:hypothetical protein